jgi:hypothetical protein
VTFWDSNRASLQLAHVNVLKLSEDVSSMKRDAIFSFKLSGIFLGPVGILFGVSGVFGSH